jgi:hypothetical protein
VLMSNCGSILALIGGVHNMGPDVLCTVPRCLADVRWFAIVDGPSTRQLSAVYCGTVPFYQAASCSVARV